MAIQNRCLSIWISLTLVLVLQTHSALAADVEIQIPTDIGASVFKDFSEEIGLAISYLPTAPAEPLGLLGWDIGVELSAVDIDRGLWSQVALPSTTPPGTVLFPKIHLHKGLPFGIDVSAAYSEVPRSNIKVIGGALKWALVSGNVSIPAIALRGSYTTLTGVDNLELETIGADISISKGFVFITPYAGYAQVWISSEATATTLQLKENINLPRPYVGVKISLAIINFVFEADFGELPIYTGRLNIGF